MITRIEVDGFKSLRGFAVDLEPFTVFIGPNSAGKSNILDALSLLSRLASQSLEEAFKHGRGRALDQFTRRGGEVGSTIHFAVEVLVDAPESSPNRYRYELTIERRPLPSGAERLAVKDERLSVLDAEADRWAAAHPEFARHTGSKAEARALLKQIDESDGGARLLLLRTQSQSDVSIYMFHSGTGIATINGINKDHGFRDMRREWRKSEVNVREIDPDHEIGLFTEEFIHYRAIAIDAARLREPSERVGSDTLAPDASNLPTVLANLPGPILGAIRADLVALVPGVSSFEIVPEGDAFRIDFELSGGERMPARLVSDGTLRILGLLTALRAEPRASTIGIEEPENGVYPGRLRRLIDYLREVTSENPRAAGFLPSLS